MTRWVAIALAVACLGCGARTPVGGIDAGAPDAGDHDASEPEEPACTPEPGPPLSSRTSTTRVTFEGVGPELASKDGRLAVGWIGPGTSEARLAVLDSGGHAVIGPLDVSRGPARLVDVVATEDGWAVLWWTGALEREPGDLRLTRLSDGGSFVSADNLVATAMDPGDAALVWPDAERAMLAWSAAEPGGPAPGVVSVARLNDTLDSLEPRTVTHRGSDLSATKTASGYAVSWFATGVRVQRLDADAEPSSEPREITRSVYREATVLSVGDELAVAYDELAGGEFSSYLAWLGPGGGPEIVELSPPGRNGSFVHAATDDRTVGAVWLSGEPDDDGAALGFARVEPGAAVPARSAIPTEPGTETSLPRVAWMGDRWAAAWDRFDREHTVVVAIDCKP